MDESTAYFGRSNFTANDVQLCAADCDLFHA
jgi:hypothetical protein